MLNLIWSTRIDESMCAEPFGLDCGYYINDYELQIINQRRIIVYSCVNKNISTLQLIAQNHYVSVLNHHIN